MILLPVLPSQPAKLLNMECKANDRTVQFVYLYHFPHIFCTTEMCYLLTRRKCVENERNETPH